MIKATHDCDDIQLAAIEAFENDAVIHDALKGGRIYPDVLPQRHRLPSVVVRVAGRRDAETLNPSCSAQTRLWICASAKTVGERNRLMKAIRMRLKESARMLGSMPIDSVAIRTQFDQQEEPRDGSDNWRFDRILIAEVWHEEDSQDTC